MSKYEIRDVVNDYGIYEDGELKLILNSRSNAEYIKAILEVDGSRPNAATIYSPVVEEMSDEECMAVFRLCCDEEYHCKTCPLNNLGDGCFLHIDRRVMDIVERDLKKKASSTSCDMEDKKQSEGEWKDQYSGKYANPIYVCSLCGKGTLLKPYINELNNMEMTQALSPYCPNCGAKMKGGCNGRSEKMENALFNVVRPTAE